MISIPQCRAARGLLNWTQQDLANASGLSKTAINNFEKGNSDIKSESLRAIQKAFERSDIEFTEGEGIRRKEEKQMILSGPYALTELLHDILQTTHSNDEVLFLNVDARPPSPEEKNQATMYMDDLKFKHINKRIICAENTISAYGRPTETKYFSADLLDLFNSTIIYGEKVATMLWQSDKIIVSQARHMVVSERTRFEACWENSKSDIKTSKIIQK